MAENEAPEVISNFTRLNASEIDDTTPTVSLSGVVFISGGGLWYKGFADTYTKLGDA